MLQVLCSLIKMSAFSIETVLMLAFGTSNCLEGWRCFVNDSWCPANSHLSYSDNLIDQHPSVMLHHVTPLVQTVTIELKRGFKAYKWKQSKKWQMSKSVRCHDDSPWHTHGSLPPAPPAPWLGRLKWTTIKDVKKKVCVTCANRQHHEGEGGLSRCSPHLSLQFHRGSRRWFPGSERAGADMAAGPFGRTPPSHWTSPGHGPPLTRSPESLGTHTSAALQALGGGGAKWKRFKVLKPSEHKT